MAVDDRGLNQSGWPKWPTTLSRRRPENPGTKLIVFLLVYCVVVEQPRGLAGGSGVRVELFRATASPTALTEPVECYHHYPRLCIP